MKGKDAYLIYCKEVGFVNFQGKIVPEFHNLPEHIQGAWAKVEERFYKPAKKKSYERTS